MVKDAGRFLMHRHGVPEYWMPAATGAMFLIPFCMSVWLLSQMPKPNATDIAERVRRRPMDGASRMNFIRSFLPGMVMLLIASFFLMAYRDFRDGFGLEILREALHKEPPDGIFTRTELWVGLGVLIVLSLLTFVRDNRLGLLGALGIMIGGLLLVGTATLALDAGLIGPVLWITLIGLGTFLAYVPYGSVLFDRLIAYTRVEGTAVLAIYLTDALGYTGAVGILLYKDLLRPNYSHLAFFKGYSYFLAAVGGVLTICAAFYFLTRRTSPTAVEQPAELSASLVAAG